ncbi:MAG TPA: ribonuclease D, partial [Chthoniobacterales bacterium]|nr:ribonuclease D [Chthoniobacterales bacterium]
MPNEGRMTKQASHKSSNQLDFVIHSSLDEGVLSTPEQVGELISYIDPQNRVAVDTEADSLHCYREKLCLLQVSLPEGDFLVDPLAENDLGALADTLSRKEIVLHGADYDLRLLRRALDFRPTRVFDTVIAARLLGVREFSYAALVEEYFGIALAKGSQKANWALRPLSEKMEEYARNDTHYLLALAAKLEKQLIERDRLEWFQQSCERAMVSAAIDRERDMEEIWRIRGSGLVRGREAAVLRALWYWRDREAQRFDRPSFHILRNDQLVEIARATVRGETPQFRHFSERRMRDFRATIEEALALKEEEWPETRRRRGERPTREMERAAEAMRKRRDQAAHELKIEPSFIAPRATIDAIAVHSACAEQLLVPWQR